MVHSSHGPNCGNHFFQLCSLPDLWNSQRQRLGKCSSLPTLPLGPGHLTRRLWEPGAERGLGTRLSTPRQVSPYRSAVPFHLGPVWLWEQLLGLLSLLAAAAWPVGAMFPFSFTWPWVSRWEVPWAVMRPKHLPCQGSSGADQSK